MLIHMFFCIKRYHRSGRSEPYGQPAVILHTNNYKGTLATSKGTKLATPVVLVVEGLSNCVISLHKWANPTIYINYHLSQHRSVTIVSAVHTAFVVQINEAYSVLHNPVERRMYDMQLGFSQATSRYAGQGAAGYTAYDFGTDSQWKSTQTDW